MVTIPEGSFPIGSDDGDVDKTRIPKVSVAAFELDVTEVTVAHYRACQTPSCTWPDVRVFCNWEAPGRDDHPINCVDWYQATAYCTWAGKRLPTEEEWEFAARGTERRTYPWGNAAPAGRSCSNRGTGTMGTCRVGSYPAGDTERGLKDLAGNVREWTSTGYCTLDGTQPVCQQRYVTRGGGWDSDGDGLRSADRLALEPLRRISVLGFRCARTVGAASTKPGSPP